MGDWNKLHLLNNELSGIFHQMKFKASFNTQFHDFSREIDFNARLKCSTIKRDHEFYRKINQVDSMFY